jgi:glycosyltransferase involved in cell wall biosynthesis
LIPVYNEAPHLERVVRGCLNYLDAAFVVDDGSTDGSGEIARKAGAVVLRHRENHGKGAALKTGFARVLKEETWDGVVVLDGDGQHDWDEIPAFISCLEKGGYDIVAGNRMRDRRSMPFRRKATNYLSSRIMSFLTGQRIEDSQCGFRLLKTDLLKRLVLKTGKFDTESELLLEAARRGFRIGSVPVPTIYGPEKSYVRPVRDTVRFLRVAAKYFFRARGRRGHVSPQRKKRC